MSTTTANLGLFKYDLATDAKSAFNITNSLNNNWDILDREISGKISTLTPAGSATNPVYVNSSGKITACSGNVGNSIKPVYISNGKFTACTSSLDIIKESKIDTEGYIKFSNNLLIEWAQLAMTDTWQENLTMNFPLTFSSKVFAIFGNVEDKNENITAAYVSGKGCTSRSTVIASYTKQHLTLLLGSLKKAKIHFLIIGK